MMTNASNTTTAAPFMARPRTAGNRTGKPTERLPIGANTPEDAAVTAGRAKLEHQLRLARMMGNTIERVTLKHVSRGASGLRKILDAGPSAILSEVRRQENARQVEDQAERERSQAEAAAAERAAVEESKRKDAEKWWRGKTRKEIAEYLVEISACSDFHQFAGYVEVARDIYRNHPTLITAAEVPEPYASKFLGTIERLPILEANCNGPTDVFHATYMKEIKAMAHKEARQLWTEDRRYQAIQAKKLADTAMQKPAA